MKLVQRRSIVCVAAVAWLVIASVASGATTVLKRAWVDRVKNRATIECELTIDKAHTRPNRPADDGDLHMAGRAPLVGLPMVVEIVNARSQAQALDVVKRSAGSGGVKVTGVWRLWFEHPGKVPQVQGQPIPVPKNSNPDHVFELHPLTKIEGIDLATSFVPIKDYEAREARVAFAHYDRLKARVSATKSGITIESPKAIYNYATFVLEVEGKPLEQPDAYFVLGSVLDGEGARVSEGLRRMVFVKGTPPATLLGRLKKGDQVRVLGIPRVNLDRISEIVRQSKGQPVETSLPYEMIVVGAEE